MAGDAYETYYGGLYPDPVSISISILTHFQLQAFMWLAMEPPTSMTGDAITEAKVRLLAPTLLLPSILPLPLI